MSSILLLKKKGLCFGKKARDKKILHVKKKWGKDAREKGCLNGVLRV